MEIPYIVNARKDTGLNNSKIAIWLFLASEVMLFGGLFSSYIFLRIFADYPWPERVLPILPGLLNTFILIASSVTVVFAWAALKLRNWKQFQGYMGFTLICAAIFMVFKGFEYSAKFAHQNVQTTDWTNVEGHTHYDEDHNSDNYYTVHTNEILFDLSSYYDPYLDEITEQIGDKPVKSLVNVIVNDFDGDKLIQNPLVAKDAVLSLDGNDEGSLRYVLAEAKDSYIETRAHNEQVRESALRQAWKNVRSNEGGRFNAIAGLTQYDQAMKDAANAEYGRILEAGDFGTLVETSGLYKVAVDNAEINIKPSQGRMSEKKEGADTGVTLLDSTVLLGKAGDSSIVMDVDAIDHRHLVLKARDREYSQEKIDAMIEDWYAKLDDSAGANQLRQYWAIHKKWRQLWTDELIEKHGVDEDGEPNKVPIDIELYRITWKQMVSYKQIIDNNEEVSLELVKKYEPGMIAGFTGANHGKYNPTDDEGNVIAAEAAFPVLKIAREDIRFESVFSPKMNNYYAIYFTITGLHGLHVIGGALVLGYYLFFGRSMYEENPEWLANRVEVGGLFWHFVDLVWIFVFPIFYLM